MRVTAEQNTPARQDADAASMAHLAHWIGGPVMIVRRPDVDPPQWNTPGMLTGEGRVGRLSRLTPVPRSTGELLAWVSDLSPSRLTHCLGNGAHSLFVSPCNLLPVRIPGEAFPGH